MSVSNWNELLVFLTDTAKRLNGIETRCFCLLYSHCSKATTGYEMDSFTITNKKPNGFFMLLTLMHVGSSISLTVREQYVAGKIKITQKKIGAIANNSNYLTSVENWSGLENLDEFIDRDILGLDQLPQNGWIKYFLPQLDELEDNAIANFELVDWFRQFGFVEQKSSFEIKGGIKILPKEIDQPRSMNKISLENKFFRKPKSNNELDSLVNKDNPKKIAKMNLKLLKGGYR